MVCSTEKDRANHWLQVILNDTEVTFIKWRDETADNPEIEHLCGPACAVKVLSQFGLGMVLSDARGAESGS